jgi:hypothetical protein
MPRALAFYADALGATAVSRATCLGTADRKGRKLTSVWRGLLLWLAAIFVALAVVTWILGRLVG